MTELTDDELMKRIDEARDAGGDLTERLMPAYQIWLGEQRARETLYGTLHLGSALAFAGMAALLIKTFDRERAPEDRDPVGMRDMMVVNFGEALHDFLVKMEVIGSNVDELPVSEA